MHKCQFGTFFIAVTITPLQSGEEGSIGQIEGGNREKCPIEELYRTKQKEETGEMSDRRALSDKQKGRTGKNVR
jgi:hypothetical protein